MSELQRSAAGPEPPDHSSEILAAQPHGQDKREIYATSDRPRGSEVVVTDDDLHLIENHLTGAGEWLRASAVGSEEQARRRKFDLAVVRRLDELGFEGEEYEELVAKTRRRFFAYGYPVVMHMCASGEIFRKCDRLKYKLKRGDADAFLLWTRDDRHAIVADTVMDGFDYFIANLRKGRWKADGGASLLTYFVNGCVIQFPRIYRRWWKDQAHREAQIRINVDEAPGPSEIADPPDPTIRDPDDDLDSRQQLQVITGVLTAEELQAFIERSQGASNRDIAAARGKTEKAVESWLARARKRVLKLLAGQTQAGSPSDAGMEEGEKHD